MALLTVYLQLLRPNEPFQILIVQLEIRKKSGSWFQILAPLKIWDYWLSWFYLTASVIGPWRKSYHPFIFLFVSALLKKLKYCKYSLSLKMNEYFFAIFMDFLQNFWFFPDSTTEQYQKQLRQSLPLSQSIGSNIIELSVCSRHENLWPENVSSDVSLASPCKSLSDKNISAFWKFFLFKLRTFSCFLF